MLFRVFGSAVRNLDDASLITFHFSVDKLNCHEGVEDVAHQCELIRHKWIVVDEVVGIGEDAVTRGQVELRFDSIFLLPIEFAECERGVGGLFENTALGDILGACAFERHLHLETSHNLAIVVARLVDLATAHDFRKVLLSGTSHPSFAFAW